MRFSGVRSSCATSLLKLRSRENEASMPPSTRFSVSACRSTGSPVDRVGRRSPRWRASMPSSSAVPSRSGAKARRVAKRATPKAAMLEIRTTIASRRAISPASRAKRLSGSASSRRTPRGRTIESTMKASLRSRGKERSPRLGALSMRAGTRSFSSGHSPIVARRLPSPPQSRTARLPPGIAACAASSSDSSETPCGPSESTVSRT